MLSAFQKELMNKLRPRTEQPPEKERTPSPPAVAAVEEEVEETRDRRLLCSPPDLQEDEVGRGGDVDGDARPLNLDAVAAEPRLSHDAAHHKIGVVRNAMHRRQRPGRTRSSDASSEPPDTPHRRSLTVDVTDPDRPQEEGGASHSSSPAASPRQRRRPSDAPEKVAATLEDKGKDPSDVEKVPAVPGAKEKDSNDSRKALTMKDEKEKGSNNSQKAVMTRDEKEKNSRDLRKVSATVEDKGKDPNDSRKVTAVRDEKEEGSKESWKAVTTRDEKELDPGALRKLDKAPPPDADVVKKVTHSEAVTTVVRRTAYSSRVGTSRFSAAPDLMPTSSPSAAPPKAAPASPGAKSALDIARRYAAARGGDVRTPLQVRAVTPSKSAAAEADEVADIVQRRSTASLRVAPPEPSPDRGRGCVITKTAPTKDSSNSGSPSDSGDRPAGSPHKPALARKTSAPALQSPLRQGPVAEPTRLRRVSEGPTSPTSPASLFFSGERTSPGAQPPQGPPSAVARSQSVKETDKPENPVANPGVVQIRKLSVNSGERPRSKVLDMMKKFET